MEPAPGNSTAVTGDTSGEGETSTVAETVALDIVVESRRKHVATLERQYPGAVIVDVTSQGPEPWRRFSPFYPHGGLPVPGTSGCSTAMSVEGLWQGLKVFEHEDVDARKWAILDLKNIKRAASHRRGRVRGHRFGPGSARLLAYREARLEIYLPAYRWILENKLSDEVTQLRFAAMGKTLVLLDFETNEDVEDLRTPLSHASLLKQFLLSTWPVNMPCDHAL